MRKFLSLLFFSVHFFIFAQKKWDIRFYSESVNRVFYIYSDNDEAMPISSKFTFKTTNLRNSLENNSIIVIPPHAKKFLIATLKPIQANAANKVEYSNTFNFGNVLQESYDADYIYSLPFETGKTHLVFQGYNGKFSHQNEFSLDLDLKLGENVLAAREGTVVDVVNTNTQSCPNISCAKYNNNILIMHSDGTFGVYAHLKYGGTVVKKGDVVEKGQLIGYSGNTGFSSGPHLHFAVFINRIDGSRTFIKTQFKTSKSEATLLEEGKNYTKNY